MSEPPATVRDQRAARRRPRRLRRARARRMLAPLLVALCAAATVLLVVSAGRAPHRPPAGTGVRVPAARSAERGTPLAPGAARTAAPLRAGGFAVGRITLRLVDPTRSISLPGAGERARTFVLDVRYPALAAPVAGARGAAPARASGPFPLIVFGHGFAVVPETYSRLLDSWARAGYVVAAPVFPLENAHAPGGPDEADLPNQPRDMSLVITSLLARSAAPSGALAGLIAGRAVAVAGQSDGGDTALAVAFDPRFRDRRVQAAVILSGAEIPTAGPFPLPPRGPALLATQGTADTINLPSETATFYSAAPSPKYLLRLLGAGHLPPYTVQQPQLRIVERVTVAFLDAYLRHAPGALRRLAAAGAVPGVAQLTASP